MIPVWICFTNKQTPEEMVVKRVEEYGSYE